MCKHWDITLSCKKRYLEEKEEGEEFSIVFGSRNRTSSHGHRFIIDSPHNIFIHERYLMRKRSYHIAFNDIALIRFSDLPIDANANPLRVNAICLPDWEVNSGNLTAAGWGKIFCSMVGFKVINL